MNANHVLFGEFAIAVGVGSWGALRNHTVPYPAGITGTALAFGLLGVVASAAPELAVVLGSGFLLAQLLLTAQAAGGGAGGKWSGAFGAYPPQAVTQQYQYLMF
jgi:hypothetical protein